MSICRKVDAIGAPRLFQARFPWASVSCLPVLDEDVVAGDRLDGLAQQLFHLPLEAPAGTVTSEACTVMMTPRPLATT